MQPDVLLINPSIDFKTQNKVLTDIIRISFPLSLGHLAGYIQDREGWNVRIEDEQITPIDKARAEELLARMTGVKIIGITTLTVTSGRAYQLSRLFKSIDPSVTTVIGGIHASILPDEGLNNGVDFVIRGEGEESLTELAKYLLNERNIEDIRGISFKDKGKIIHNESRPLVNDLNTMPRFPYHLFEHNRDKYSGFYSIQTSRGCPYACIFCSQRSITGKRYRYISTQRALDDIRLLIEKYDASTIRILDDNIAAVKKRLINLCEGIVEEGFHKRVSFEAPMRADNMDEEVLKHLKAANFSVITFGLETGSERLMKVINKGETVADVIKAINMTSEAGITVGTTLIFGLPTETRQDRIKTIRLVNSLPLDSARYNILTPYPDTPIYHQLKQEGKEVEVLEGWLNFSVQYMWENDDIPYVPEGTDKYELILTTMFANLWYYLCPKGLRKMFTKSVAGGNVVILPKRWYFSRYAFKLVRVGLYLFRRFTRIFFKMIFFKTKQALGFSA